MKSHSASDYFLRFFVILLFGKYVFRMQNLLRSVLICLPAAFVCVPIYAQSLFDEVNANQKEKIEMGTDFAKVIVQCFRPIGKMSGDLGPVSWLNYICTLSSGKILLVHSAGAAGVNGLHFSTLSDSLNHIKGWTGNAFFVEPINMSAYAIRLSGKNGDQASVKYPDPTYYGNYKTIVISGLSECYLDERICYEAAPGGAKYKTLLSEVSKDAAIAQLVQSRKLSKSEKEQIIQLSR